ncbi:MAG: hypothetical protein OQK29_01405 [Ignavibacteriaceae bacterium]|nr:hypothetical protein [Ignavibacteriaceae bacterium]
MTVKELRTGYFICNDYYKENELPKLKQLTVERIVKQDNNWRINCTCDLFENRDDYPEYILHISAKTGKHIIESVELRE